MKYRTDAPNILRSVDIVFQVMAKAAHRWNGLFPAVAERHNGQILQDFPLPPVIPGQRNSDRSPRGCNLAHDIALLAALDGLGRGLDRSRYLLLREDYLTTFAKICAPASPTGLLPWGEHSFWNLGDGSIGNSYLLEYHDRPIDASVPIHHQLDMLPMRDWRTIQEANPEVLPRFVEGLDWHWMDEARTVFNRHAPLTQFIRGYPNKRHELLTGVPAKDKTGSDFPSAAGVFIHDYAMALALVRAPDPAWREVLRRWTDSWWERRLETGVCPKSGSTDPKAYNGASLGQTVDHARCLLQSAEDLEASEPELVGLLKERGVSFVRAMLDYPQKRADEGALANSFRPDGAPNEFSAPWASNRGNPNTARFALKLLYAARRAEEQRGIELVHRAALPYQTQFLPREQIVRAGDPGLVIGLCTELYLATEEKAWLEAAFSHATDALELFFDCPLPKVALGRQHYEAQQGSSILVHALARLYLVAEGQELVGGLAQPAT